MDREAFLSAVRSSLGTGTVPVPGPLIGGSAVPGHSQADLLERFTASLETVDGTVHTTGGLAALDEIVALHGPGRLIAWDDASLPTPGAAERLVAAGCGLVDSTVPRNNEGRGAHQSTYFDVRFGLTGAEAAFAESGSIVIRSGSGRPRMASLIPLVHIALLPVDRIFRSQMDWMSDGDADLAEVANVVYVTGPSRTADIEQQLNLGVHGPRAVHVVVV
ncbi:MAG: LUD domain-containing protein [Acidimicrobiia bacterium]